jgi:hypothetical protein
MAKENIIPNNDKARKPTPKKEFSLSDFKKKTGSNDVPFKPFEWIRCSDAIAKAIGLPGIAKGYVNLCRGFSNTGKSTMLCESVVSAQKMGILPIIIDTENNLGRKRLELMGFDFDNDFFIMIDNEFLLEQFGKKQNKNRSEAAIEDLAKCMHYFLDLQENGELPFDLLFAVDSIGTLDCIKTIDAAEKDSNNNNMWNAGAMASAFKSLMNFRIPNSKKVDKQYTNTFVGVQKVWYDSAVGGQGVLRHSGGEALFSASRLIIHFGGNKTHGTSRVVATSKGKELTFGIKVAASVAKNHLDDIMGGIAFNDQDIISTPHGFIGAEKEDVENYKKEHLKYFRDVLGGDIDIEDIETKYIKIKNDEKIDFGIPESSNSGLPYLDGDE